MSESELEASAIVESSLTGKLVRKQDERLVLHAMRRLPPAFQVVLKLSFFDGLSGPQIAELLQIPEPTVRSRVWRALQRLKNETLLLADDTAGVRETRSELRHWAERIHRALENQSVS
jgi:RNA polymerase sigma-70 factor (ECF subfamily)